jgi:hypothetical protein
LEGLIAQNVQKDTATAPQTHRTVVHVTWESTIHSHRSHHARDAKLANGVMLKVLQQLPRAKSVSQESTVPRPVLFFKQIATVVRQGKHPTEQATQSLLIVYPVKSTLLHNHQEQQNAQH